MTECPLCHRTNRFENYCGYCDKSYHDMAIEMASQIRKMKEAFSSIFYNSLWSVERGLDGSVECSGCETKYVYHEDIKEIHLVGEECELCDDTKDG